MNRLLLLLMVLGGCIQAQGQLLSWTPPFPVEDDPAQTLVITMDANKGNQGLLNYSNTSDVYVHIGVITNLSNSGWAYDIFTWGTTNPAARATYTGSNKWTFTINGSLKDFFGITNPNEHILKIAILFRNGNGSQAQRNSDQSDMFVPVYTSALAVRLDEPPTEPRFIPVPEAQNLTTGSVFPVSAVANQPSSITLLHNGTVLATAANVQSLTTSATVLAFGNQQIVAMATAGTATTYDTINILVTPPSSPVAALPPGVRDGINYHSGSSATLVLRAPGKDVVVVTGEFNNWTPGTEHIMNVTPDGRFFWITLNSLSPGVEYAYQYIVDGQLKIADPYAEKVLDPWNDQYITNETYPSLKPYPAGQTGIVSVLQTNQPDYNWNVTSFQRPDKRGLVIYELLLRDFVSESNWQTLQDSLDYLKTLGVNAIELMPFNEFEGNISWGYNPSFFFAPDKYYGTKNALKEFIDSCHSKGIAVIMDMVLNHAFGLSPMVQLYWDAANNRPAADNPWFNPVAKHPFNVGFDFNHGSAETKYFFSRVVEHWLQEYKLDGFRFDLSKGFTQNNTCTTAGCNSGTEISNWSAYDASRIQIWKGYYDTLMLKSPGSYVILEHLSANTEEQELAAYGMLLWGHMNHNYGHAATANTADWDLSWGLYSVRGFSQPHLVTYMESHDEERNMFKALVEGKTVPGYNIKDTTTALKRMELNAALYFTMPGPKMIWQFGELGYHYSINTCEDLTINNNCRLSPKPVRWDFLNDTRRRNVYDVYSELINLRHHPWYKQAFISGTTTHSLNTGYKWLKLSSGDSSHLVVVGNFSTGALNGTVTFPQAGTWFEYFTDQPFTATGAAQTIGLAAGEYKVFVNRNVKNIAVTPVHDLPWQQAALQAKVYPNPAPGSFQLELHLPSTGTVQVKLLSRFGQLLGYLHNGLLHAGKRNLQLNTSHVAPGVYFLQVSTRNNQVVTPVTIQ